MPSEVLLNGQFVPYEQAHVSVEDRGFQFAEGVYEVIRVYRGRAFEMERHMRRLRLSAEGIGLGVGPWIDDLEAKSLELLRRSGLEEARIYLQVSTGAAPRAHLRPTGLEPTVVAMVQPVPDGPDRRLEEGISAITVSDDRWARCYLKTTVLMSNTMAKKQAVDRGCDDAIFLRDGFAMEATASNLFAVTGGALCTAPKSNYVLHGITRELVLGFAASDGIPWAEIPIPASSLYDARELFLTGTGVELVAITTLDGKTIGNRRPGPVFARMLELYRRRTLGD